LKFGVVNELCAVKRQAATTSPLASSTCF
jgi:hypothetical protein